MTTQRLQLISIGSTVILTSALVMATILTVRSKAQDVQTQPAFTVVYETSTTSARTGVVLTKRHLEAHRGDRSTAETLPDYKFAVRRVILVPEKQEIQVGDALGMKSTLDYSAAYAALPSRPASASQTISNHCTPNPALHADYLGDEMVLGINAFGYHRIEQDSDGASEAIDTWYAPTLSCYPVKMQTQLRDSSGAVTGTFKRRTVSIVMGEPDGALFQIPAAYDEVLPSVLTQQLMLAQMAADGMSAERQSASVEKMQKYCERQDQKYQLYPPHKTH